MLIKKVLLFVLQTDSGSPLIFGDKLIGIAIFLYKRRQNYVVFIRTDSLSEYIDSMKIFMENDNYTIDTFTMRTVRKIRI